MADCLIASGLYVIDLAECDEMIFGLTADYWLIVFVNLRYKEDSRTFFFLLQILVSKPALADSS